MNWTDLVAKLPRMTEREIEAAIAEEAKRDSPRVSHMARMHARYSKLRAARERKALLRGV